MALRGYFGKFYLRGPDADEAVQFLCGADMEGKAVGSATWSGLVEFMVFRRKREEELYFSIETSSLYFSIEISTFSWYIDQRQLRVLSWGFFCSLICRSPDLKALKVQLLVVFSQSFCSSQGKNQHL